MIMCPKLKVKPYIFQDKRYEGSQGAISFDSCTKCIENKGIIGKSKKNPVRIKCGWEQEKGSFKIIPNIPI